MKPTTQDKIEAVEIIRKLIKNYGVQYTSDVSDGVLTELDNRVKKLERELSALLAPPAPKKPRKPKAAAPENEWTVVTPQAIYKVVPTPDGLQHTGNAITKRSRGK